jgi:hypothetical protein
MPDIPALLERFRRGPEVLAAVLTGVSLVEGDFVTAPGKWSIRQIVAHVADARRRPQQSLDTFQRIRAENYELLKTVPAAGWDRTGNHTENGPMTLLRLVEGYAGHAESHAKQLQGIREAFKRHTAA